MPTWCSPGYFTVAQGETGGGHAHDWLRAIGASGASGFGFAFPWRFATLEVVDPADRTTGPTSGTKAPPAIPGERFRYLRWAGVIGGAAVGLVLFLYNLFPAVPLKAENGPLEIVSWLCWLGAALVAVSTAVRTRSQPDRLVAIWIACVAVLAFLRELDAHILLNPERLGRFGVRYRADWWLNGDVSLWLKLGWATLAVALVIPLIYIPLKVRLPWLRMAWRGGAMAGLFFLGLTLLANGFVMDDLLRGVTIVTKDVRPLLEETSELLGALAFGASTWLRWRYSLKEHVEAVGLTMNRPAE